MRSERANHAYGKFFQRDSCVIHFERAENLYDAWPPPTCIIVDGPYGVNGFPGDQYKAASLADWYTPHKSLVVARHTPSYPLVLGYRGGMGVGAYRSGSPRLGVSLLPHLGQGHESRRRKFEYTDSAEISRSNRSLRAVCESGDLHHLWTQGFHAGVASLRVATQRSSASACE